MIFSTLVGVLNRVRVGWYRAVSITTDSAPSMIGKKAGVAIKFKENVQVVSRGHAFWTFHCILHQDCVASRQKCITSCKWLSGQLISSEPQVLISQFDSLLSDKAFFIYEGKLKTLCANNHFQISLNSLH